MSLDVYLVNRVFTLGITHNLGPMAKEAGIYQCLWEPQALGIGVARDLIVPLAAGLALLEANPPRFEALNPDNGWGTYNNFCDFVREYLAACRMFPDSLVEVSR